MLRCGPQVISPQNATGVVEVVHGLHEVQEKTYSQPTVLLAEQVRQLACRAHAMHRQIWAALFCCTVRSPAAWRPFPTPVQTAGHW